MRPFSLFCAFLIGLSAVAGSGCGKRQAELQVRVLDGATGSPVAGAVVEADFQRERTNAAGVARMLLNPDAHELRVEHKAYVSLASSVVLTPGMTALKTVNLEPRPAEEPSPSPVPSPLPSGASPAPQPSPSVAPRPQVLLFGRVTDERGNRLGGAYVFVESPFIGIPFGSAVSNKQGEYKVGELPVGKQMRVTAIADGYRSVTRVLTPSGEWRLDFTGAYGLKPQSAAEQGVPLVRVGGVVEDTRGRALDGVMIKVESENVRYPFNESAIAHHGRYEIKVPTGIPLRFLASKGLHRAVTFVDTLKAGSGEKVEVDFTGARALDPILLKVGASSEGDAAPVE